MSPRVRQIIDEVAAKHGVAPNLLLSDLRTARVSEARFEAYHRVRQIERPGGGPMFSLIAIGALFNRDHTTVLHGLGRWKAMERKRLRRDAQTIPRAVDSCGLHAFAALPEAPKHLTQST